MSSPLNPYRPPEAAVTDIRDPAAEMLFRAPAAGVDAARGVSWIGEGWALFKLAPALWITALVILLGIQLLLDLLPLIGNIASMLISPLLMAGVLAFAHGLAAGEEADLGRLFVGFRAKTGALVTVALLYFVMIVAVVIVAAVAVAVLLGSASIFNAADPEAALVSLMTGASGMMALVIALLALAAIFLIAAAYWFAPGLVYYTDLGPVAAMKASFAACLRNWLPLLLYSIVAFLVLLGGALVLLIGLLVAVPVLMASYYACFRDLFGVRQ